MLHNPSHFLSRQLQDRPIQAIQVYVQTLVYILLKEDLYYLKTPAIKLFTSKIRFSTIKDSTSTTLTFLVERCRGWDSNPLSMEISPAASRFYLFKLSGFSMSS